MLITSNRYPRDGVCIALPATTASGRKSKKARWLISVSMAAAILATSTPTTASTGTTVTNDIFPVPSSDYPSLDLVQSILRTSARQDFAGHHGAYAAAQDWQRQQLLNNNNAAPYLACADYGQGLDARDSLEQEFGFRSVHPVSHSATNGACFLATAVPSAAETLLQDPSRFGLTAAGPFLSALKIAPGVLDHDVAGDRDVPDSDQPSEKMFEGTHVLQTKHGHTVALDGVRGLSVKLSPGTVTMRHPEILELVRNWHSSLMSR